MHGEIKFESVTPILKAVELAAENTILPSSLICTSSRIWFAIVQASTNNYNRSNRKFPVQNRGANVHFSYVISEHRLGPFPPCDIGDFF